MERRQDRHIEQFYEWEMRGRGWLVFQEPIQLECEYYPFFMHRTPMQYHDDGVRHTLLSSIAEVFRTPIPKPTIHAPECPPIEAYQSVDTDMRSIGISWKQGNAMKPDRMEQLFAALIQLTNQMSFELIATHERISIQLVCPQEDYDLIRSHIGVYLPEAILKESDSLAILNAPTYTVDYGLQQEFMRPLASYSGEYDWYAGLCATLDLLHDGEQVILQVLFTGTGNAWSESIIRSVTINGKDSFFEDAPDMPSLAQKKIERPLVAATVRVCVQAPSIDRAGMLFNQVSAALISASTSPHNALVPLGSTDYDFDLRIQDIATRRSHRLGMLLNVRELAMLAHVPSASVRSRKLFQYGKTTKQPPLFEGTYCIGINDHQGQLTPVSLSDEIRSQHIHIIGATGTGKSTLFHSLICQDIEAGNGCAVLDPHGDLIDHILPYIPKHRINDVLIIDPSDAYFPVGFNLLHAHTELEKQLLASDLVALFRRFASSWGDQMNSVLANAILAFLESTQGGTLIELRRFLIEKPYREQFLNSVQDEAVVYYWRHEYPLLKGGSLGSILTRLDAFLRPKLIRNMVSQRASFNVEELMNTKKIVLVKLAQGLIGEENGYLLGACIVAKIQQAAMARQATAKQDRTPFYLYIDEFHHFITPSLATILTGARKYGLGLIVAHQDMKQVSEQSAEIASSLIANAGTRICFRLGDADAKNLAPGFASFAQDDLQNLERGEAIVRIGRAQDDCNMHVKPIPLEHVCNEQEHIIEASRKTYATKSTNSIQDHGTHRTPPSAEPLPHAPIAPIAVTPILPMQEEQTKARLIGRIEQKQHRYWQNNIKKIAEERGYKADIELPVLNGTGKVDVSLERDGIRIAVEISVSTKPTWELHNIQKCLSAGFTTVIACSENKQTVSQMREHVMQHCTEEERKRIILTDPNTVCDYIPMQHSATIPEQHVIKGYRVSVSYESMNETERMQKSMSVSRIVREAMGKKQ